MSILGSLNVILACLGCPSEDAISGAIDTLTKGVSVVQDLEFPQKSDKESESISENFRLNPIRQSGSDFYVNNPNYKRIAEYVSQAGYSPAFQNILSKRLASKSLRQARLPQISNEISYTNSDDVLARIDVDQVIFGNGKFSAQKRSLRAEEVKAVAEYELEANLKIEEALKAYLNAVHNFRKIEEIDAFIDIYRRFLDMADARVKGGVANRTEFRLFELKLAQTEAERKRYEAEFRRYKIELETLTETQFSELDFEIFKQDPLSQSAAQMPYYDQSIYNMPEYRISEAEIEARMGELDVEKAAYRPELSVRASFGHDTNFGAIGKGFDADARLVLRISKPFYWGENLDVKALRNDVQTAKTQLLQTYRELSIEKDVQLALLGSYQSQLDSNSEVAFLAKKRRNTFDQDFKAGAVSMAEAVSVLETAKTVQFQYLDSLYLLRLTELEYVRSLGHLGPLKVDPVYKEDDFIELLNRR